ncbi:MAG: MGH1-like glycoside hydrolase domain-containing protein [Solirubrobacteraceae bacterium]
MAAADPTFSTRDRNLIGPRLYWRGPTWVNSAWLVWLGLVRLGYDEAAETLATRLASTIAAHGLREYYNPYTGAGMGAVDFGWSSLVLELIEGGPRARGSYLDPSLGQYADPGRPWTSPPNTSTS